MADRILVFGLSGDKLGGINSFLINMNRNMSHEVVFDYVIEGPNSISAEDIAKNGSREFHFPYYRKNPIKALTEIINIMKSNRDNHRIAYFNLYSMFFGFEAILAKLMGYQVVLHAHNNNIESKSGLYMFIHKVNRAVLRCLKCTRLTNSELSTEFLFGKKMNDKVILIRNSIDVNKYAYSEDIRNRTREKLGINGKTVIGFSGRLQEQKNPLFLIDIFECYHRMNANSVLVIAGEGIMQNDVKRKIEEKDLQDSIYLLGNRNDMPELYQAMDLFLLPSLFEGLGIVLIEAQCSGLPCLASADVVPKTAQVSDTLLQYVSLSEPPEVWAQTIAERLNVAVDRNQGYQYVRKAGFDIQEEAIRLEKIMTRLHLGLADCNEALCD